MRSQGTTRRGQGGLKTEATRSVDRPAPKIAQAPKRAQPHLPELPSSAETRVRPLNQLSAGSAPAWQVRCGGPVRLEDGRLDARAYCQQVLEHLQRVAQTHPPQPCCVVFDLDNTLFDTRARTLAVLQQFDLEHGTHHFSQLGVDDMGWSGKETCGRLGLDAQTTEAVQAAWEVGFWAGENFKQDLVIMPLAELAWAAKSAGAEVRYLTGRIEALASASLAQLQQAGLPDADAEHLFCKPSVETATGPFKAKALEAFLAQGEFVGWFATDNRKEVEDLLDYAQSHRSVAFPVVHVEHALQRPGTVPLSVPTYPEADLSHRKTACEARAIFAGR